MTTIADPLPAGTLRSKRLPGDLAIWVFILA